MSDHTALTVLALCVAVACIAAGLGWWVPVWWDALHSRLVLAGAHTAKTICDYLRRRFNIPRKSA